MKVINISTDESILVVGSRTYKRVREYSSLVDEYYCLVFTNRKVNIIEDGNFKVIPVYGNNKLTQVLSLYRIFHHAKLDKEYVIFSQDAFEVGLLSYFLAEKFNLKLITQMHTDISTKFFRQESARNMLQYYISKFVLKHSDVIRVVSQKMKWYLHAELGISKDKIHVLPIYIDISHFTFKLKKKRVNKILMISRIEEVKNIPLGIKAVQGFRKLSRNDITLRIVGKGNLKHKYLKANRDKKWIEWADWTEDVEKEYHNADLLLVTSNYEGWGLTSVESVASGTPVAISPVGVAHEFILDGINGFVSRGHDPLNIMEAIYKTLDHKFDEQQMKLSLGELGTKEEFIKGFELMLYS